VSFAGLHNSFSGIGLHDFFALAWVLGLGAGAVSDLLFAAGHGFFEAVRLALGHDDLAAMDESVDEGDDDRRRWGRLRAIRKLV
jgi:hypothetical protein